MKKIKPSDIKRKQLAETLQREGTDMVTDYLARVQEHALQEALEAEVDEFLGRPWYQRGANPTQGQRNGYYQRTVKTTGHRLHLAIPRVRNTVHPFKSRILSWVAGITERLHQWVVELYVRGLSTRDLEEAFVDAAGHPFFSRSRVSQLAQRLYDEYHAFCLRDLSHLDVVFLFLDGVNEAIRGYIKDQVLLCAWAICADGHKTLVHLAPAASESGEAWRLFCADMQRRGLRHPLVVITDGGAGLLAAVPQAFPQSDRQRCLVHKLRNLAATLPKDLAEHVLAEVKLIYYAPDRSTADLLAQAFIEKYAQRYPSMVNCFLDDLNACLTLLKYPEVHRRYIRSTNLLERAFEEEKRRTKIMPQHPHERSAVGLVFGVLYRTSQRWNKVRMSTTELTQLRHLRSLMCPDAGDTQFISFRIAA